jgi:YVTN family beta-propeller protein
MPEHEPVISQATTEHPAADTAVQSPAPASAYAAPGYAPVEGQDEWLEEPEELLPRRPRRRLIGAGGNSLALALVGVLLAACGFIGGVLIEKGETSSSSTTGSAAAGLASRFRALRGATGAGTSASTTGAGAASSAAGGFTRPTAGTVAYLAGKTLYVTNSEGNTIKVITTAGTSVTKTVKSSVKSIHPGETVTVTGETGSGGSVSAESISVGSSSGGLAALFGGGAGSSSSSSRSSSGASTPSLFGSG